jgi:hypothetical protein
MTHDKIYQYRTRKENQYGSLFSQGIRFACRGCSRPVIPIRDIEATGVSLCEGGRVCRQKNTSARSEGCLHGQTLPKSYVGVTEICPIQGTNAKRSGHTGLGGFSLQRSEAWLSRGKGFEKLSLNTVLTDCQHEKSGKHTRFSSLTKFGVRALGKE